MANLGHDTFRDVDAAKWEGFTQKMVDGAARQLEAARRDMAETIELGARVAYALNWEN